MATVVGFLDRDEPDANTDVLVRVDPASARLEWIPRDLWCRTTSDRINRAWASGRGSTLHAVLAEHGLDADRHVIVSRALAAHCLEDVDIEVPVDRREEFWYPLHPTASISDGRKRVSFEPPIARLRGERVHQWIGARYRIDGSGSDLDRISRQQVLVRELLRQRFDFQAALAGGPPAQVSGPGALRELSEVGPGWEFAVLGGLRDARLDGKAVLVREAAV